MTIIALAGGLLRPLEPPDCSVLASKLAAMDPWARLGYGAAALDAYLGRQDGALTRWAAEQNGEMAGILALRHPWLRGPYVEMLAVLPGHQGHGLGGALMEWTARHAAEVSRNLWACVSDFNTPARAFYARHGFEEIAPLDGLVQPGMAEILLRKRL